jgi:hypothetical protein
VAALVPKVVGSRVVEHGVPDAQAKRRLVRSRAGGRRVADAVGAGGLRIGADLP